MLGRGVAAGSDGSRPGRPWPAKVDGRVGARSGLRKAKMGLETDRCEEQDLESAMNEELANDAMIGTGATPRGRVVGIGVGPGDPGLLTLRAARLLGEADLVVAPGDEQGDGLALSIARPHLGPACAVRTVGFPMRESRAACYEAWESAALLLAEGARNGKLCVFVCLGDPLLYGTWGYVLDALYALHPDVDTQTVPGVTAMCAVAARLGQPLAERRQPLVIWPGKPGVGLEAALAEGAAAVVMKAGYSLAEIEETALRAGRKARGVTRCGLEGEEIHEVLAESRGGDYFTTALIEGSER